jgi:hypothetical protein
MCGDVMKNRELWKMNRFMEESPPIEFVGLLGHLREDYS